MATNQNNQYDYAHSKAEPERDLPIADLFRRLSNLAKRILKWTR
jgi:hypothetical protein